MEFPLSQEQLSMLFHENLLGPGVAHNITSDIALPADVTAEQVGRAVERLLTEQSALRSGLAGDPSRGLVLGEASADVVVSPVASVAEALPRRYADLHNAELYPRTTPRRAYFELVKDATEQRLLISLDHLCADGFSVGLLAATLRGYLGIGEPVAPPDTSFVGFCRAQPALIAAVEAAEIAEWSRLLAGVEPLRGFMPHAGPGDRLTRAQRDSTYTGLAHARAARSLCSRLRVTPFALFAALTSLAVWRRSGSRAFVIHTPVDTRRDAQTRALLGYFVNERPIVCRVDPDRGLGEHIRSVRTACADAVRLSRIAEPRLVDAVPELRAALREPGIDYIQLHVDVDAQALPGAVRRGQEDAGEVVHETVELGAFQPSIDLTCTTLRYSMAPDRTQVRAFFGGPVGGLDTAGALADDAMAILLAAEGRLDEPVASLPEPAAAVVV